MEDASKPHRPNVHEDNLKFKKSRLIARLHDVLFTEIGPASSDYRSPASEGTTLVIIAIETIG